MLCSVSGLITWESDVDSEKVRNLAVAWFEGTYTEQQARMSATIQVLDFNAVSDEYGRLYEEMERLSHGS